MAVKIRVCRPEELDRVKQLTVEAFQGVSIDQNIERHFGAVAGGGWKARKARHIDEDFRRDPQGIFVAEENGQVVGYITTWMDRASGIGNIPNLSVSAECRGQGIGRELIEFAVEHFRRSGMSMAKIETLDQNPIGQHLYPSIGFVEIARQIHFVMPLEGHSKGPAGPAASANDSTTSQG